MKPFFVLNPKYFLIVLFPFCIGLAGSLSFHASLVDNDPSVLNHPSYLELLESSDSRISVRFKADPSAPIPEQVRMILAVPSHDFQSHWKDYAYYDLTGNPENLIRKGSAHDRWEQESLDNRLFQTKTLFWHDLPLLVVTISTRLNSASGSPTRTYRLCALDFTLDFRPARSSDQDYRIRKRGEIPGGFADIFHESVLNPDSVPRFRRRPVIEMSDHYHAPEALGRYSSSGNTIRILVEKEGWTEVPYAELVKTDAGIEQWVPDRVNLWAQGRIVPVELTGLDASGNWTEQSRVCFWALPSASPDSRESIYFLSEGTQERIGPQQGPSPSRSFSATALRSVTDQLMLTEERIFEDDQHSFVRGKWFWMKLTDKTPEMTIELPPLHVDPQSSEVELSLSLHSDVQGQTTLEILIDSEHPLGTVNLSGRTRQEITKKIPAEWLLQEKHTLVLRPISSFKHSDSGGIYLEYLKWNYERLLSLTEGQLILNRSLWEKDSDLLLDSTSPLQIFGRDDSGTRLWDLSGLLEQQESGTLLRLGEAALEPEIVRLLIVEAGAAHTCFHLKAARPANLRQVAEPVDVLYISHRNFIEALQPLVEHRRQEGWRVAVIDVQDVYDEFSGGYYSANAIRDFIIYTQTRWPSPIPQYVVLVGDSSFDPKNNLEGSVVSYMPFGSFNRANPHADPADEWFVRIHGTSGLSDLIIGRISVSSPEDVQDIVRKILLYENQPLLGPWRARTIVLSDNHFESRCESIVTQSIPEKISRAHLELRRYMMSTNQRFRARGSNKKLTASGTRDLITRINEGYGLLQYFGHGGGSVIADEGWMIGTDRENSDVLKLDNRRRLPFVAILSCLTGLINYPIPPFNYSLSEELVRRPVQGAIGVYGPSGYGGAQDHDVLTRGLNRSLYTNRISRLGDAVNLAEGYFHLLKGSTFIIEQFNYFGDPLTRSWIPSQEGSLVCSPEVVNAARGDRLHLSASGLPFTEGKGILRIYHPAEKKLIYSQPVRLTEGRCEVELLWQPEAPQGTMLVQGYFWDPVSRQDAITSVRFQSVAPNLSLHLASVQWDQSLQSAVLNATLNNPSLLDLDAVEVTLTQGEVVIEQREVAVKSGAQLQLEFRIPETALEKLVIVDLEADFRKAFPFAPDASGMKKGIRLALVVDQPAEGRKELLVADLTGSPEPVYSEETPGQLPLRIYSSAWSDLTHLEIGAGASFRHSQTFSRKDGENPEGKWWAVALPVSATDESGGLIELDLQRQWAGGVVRESTWTIPQPRILYREIALTHAEVADVTPIEGYSIFTKVEFHNRGDEVRNPSRIIMRNEGETSQGNPLSNTFNVEIPTLPGILQRGEIVRRLYRWESFENKGQWNMVCELQRDPNAPDINLEHARLEFPLTVATYNDFLRRLEELRFSPAGGIASEIQKVYLDCMREVERMAAYEFFNENFVHLHMLHRIALYALGAERYLNALHLTERSLEMNAGDPGGRYLEAIMRTRQHRMAEAADALRAVFQQGFYENRENLSWDVQADPRYLRARRQGLSRHWRGAEDLFYLILEQQPTHYLALMELGDMYRRLGYYEKAVETYQQIARLVDYDHAVIPARWYISIGQAYAELDDPHKALDIFALGAKYHPEVDFSLWKAQPRVALSQYQDVLDDLKSRSLETLELPERVFAWHQIGRCYQGLHQLQNAQEAFRAALREDPLHQPSRRELLQMRTQSLSLR